jgi:ABC-type dipeptide/oligopeptide/nickel transport system permease subunit
MFERRPTASALAREALLLLATAAPFLAPTLVFTVSILGFNLLADGLRRRR